jgi:hypothetical protein
LPQAVTNFIVTAESIQFQSYGGFEQARIEKLESAPTSYINLMQRS